MRKVWSLKLLFAAQMYIMSYVFRATFLVIRRHPGDECSPSAGLVVINSSSRFSSLHITRLQSNVKD